MQIGSRSRRAGMKLAASAGMLLALASCSGTVSDDVSLSAVQSQGEGIVIIAATFPGGYFCSALALHVSRKVDGKRRRAGFTASSLFKGDSPAQSRLKAGNYELNNMVCNTGNYEVSLHKQQNIFSSNRDPLPVYGRFKVAPGEVVNLGHVSIKWAAAGVAQLSVTNLSAEHRTWLKQNRPKLSSRMVTRLMRATTPRLVKRKKQ